MDVTARAFVCYIVCGCVMVLHIGVSNTTRVIHTPVQSSHCSHAPTLVHTVVRTRTVLMHSTKECAPYHTCTHVGATQSTLMMHTNATTKDVHPCTCMWLHECDAGMGKDTHATQQTNHPRACTRTYLHARARSWIHTNTKVLSHHTIRKVHIDLRRDIV